MTWSTMKLRDGTTWAVDWEAMQRIYRWYCASGLQLDRKYLKVLTQEDLLGPRLQTVDVDWQRLNADAFTQGVNLYANAAAALHAGRSAQAEGIAGELQAMQIAAAANKRKFQERVLEVSRANHENINRSSDNWQLLIEGSKIVRDTSFGFVTSGAMLLTGGSAAGLALLGSGSALTGIAKYQDTYNPAAAVMAATGALMFNALPVKLKGVDKAVLVLLKGQWEVAQGMIEGKTILESALQATGKIALDEGASAFVKLPRLKDWLARQPVPLKTVVTETNPAETALKQGITKTAQPFVKTGVKTGLEAVLKAFTGPAAQEGPPLAQRSVLGGADTLVRPLRRLAR